MGSKQERLRRKTILTLAFLSCIVVSFAQTANFTANTTSGCSPLVVNFQDQSTGAASWLWDFGNGATSTLQNPSTTYFTPGNYSIKLTVTNVNGSNTLIRNQYITVYGKPTVNFVVNDSIACFPHHAQFTDLSGASTGTSNTSWLWDFGDGSQGSAQNPPHTYTTSGNYTVTLKVTNDKGCFSVFTKPAYIKISGGVVSGFTNSQPVVCRPPFSIDFTNNSTGPGTLTWYWDFGDGNTSTVQNPSHNYSSPGNYTVSLATTSSSGCSDTLKKVNLFNILNINTAFTAPDSICVNSPVSFSNTSTPAPQNSNWNFGDGNTSTSQSPIKVYNTAGIYTVHLTNTYSYCTDSFSKPIKILARPSANFIADVNFKCQPSLTVHFSDLSTNAVSWSWSFGDGATSTQQNPTHTYNSFGIYDVKLVVTNSSGCTDTLTRQAYIKIVKPTISFINLPIQGCVPFNISPVANINTLDVVTSYAWDFGDGFTSNLANPNHTYPIQGTYTVSLTITTSTGCTEPFTMTNAVKVGRKPVVNFSAAPNPVCAFLPVHFTDLTNEADQWLWNFGDGSTSGVQNPSHQYSDTGYFSVMLTATNNGCKDSFKINNYIYVKPPIAKYGFQTTCLNRLQFNFLDSSIGATSWFWDFGDGTTSIQQNPIHFFPAYNTYTVTLTVSNDTCSHSETKQIKVFKESPDFTVSDSFFCRRNTIYFYGVSSNLSNIANFLWDFGDGTQWNSTSYNSGNYASHYYSASGNYTISLITTDLYGCMDTIVKPNLIRVNGPIASFNAINTSGCKGLTTTFNDLSQNDGVNNIVNWNWDFGDGTVQNINTPPVQHTYPLPGTYSVKLSVTDALGCKDSIIAANLINTSDPHAMFNTADTLSCPGSTVHFTNSSTGINYSSTWNFGDGNTSAQNSPANIYNLTGLYTIKLTITDQYGCSDSLTRPNYVKVDKPVASFTMSDSISSCIPFEVDFTNTSHYLANSAWSLGGGNSGLTNPVQFYNTPGTYPIRLIMSSPGGCLDSAFGTVRVYDTVGSNITYLPLAGCKPLSVNLNAFSPGPMSYTWDFGDGVLVTTNTNSTSHIYYSFGDFIPKVILKDPAGCIIPVTGVDTIHIKGATVKFGLDKRFFCDSGSVSFIDSTIYNDSLSVYNWDFGDGSISHVQNPSHHYTSPGIYTVALNVQTLDACVDTFRLNNVIKIVESPLVSITGDSIVCVNGFMNHLGAFVRPDTSQISWNWQFPNGNNSNTQNPAPQQYSNAGNFVVTAIATDRNGCADTTTKNILVNPLPTVTMPSTITMQAGYPVQIPATYTSNVVGYLWSPSNTLNCSGCPQPTASPKFNTNYVVSFVDSNGCKNTGQVQIIVICKDANVFVPNTFSPNKDGSNDVFYIRGRGLDRVKSLRVFNRWGEVVFEKYNFPVNDPLYGWDGTYKGNKPVADVYVYQVEVFCDNSQIIHFSGNVALIQ